eukprot:scaffold88421_cov75-Phaeocystis_antarctica.AAC.1
MNRQKQTDRARQAATDRQPDSQQQTDSQTDNNRQKDRPCRPRRDTLGTGCTGRVRLAYGVKTDRQTDRETHGLGRGRLGRPPQARGEGPVLGRDALRGWLVHPVGSFSPGALCRTGRRRDGLRQR